MKMPLEKSRTIGSLNKKGKKEYIDTSDLRLGDRVRITKQRTMSHGSDKTIDIVIREIVNKKIVRGESLKDGMSHSGMSILKLGEK